MAEQFCDVRRDITLCYETFRGPSDPTPVPLLGLGVYPVFLRRAPAEREAFSDRMERLFALIGSRDIPRDPAELRRLAAESYDRDHDPFGTLRQLAAIMASGDRTPELRRIAVPTLVIHGSADRLVTVSGGR